MSYFVWVGGLQPDASDTTRGLLSKSLFSRLNQIGLSWGVGGGGKTTWQKIGSFRNEAYMPIHIEMYYGMFNKTKTKYSINITFYSDSAYVTGNSGLLLGYVLNSSGNFELYAKCDATYSMSAIITGGSIDSTIRSSTTIEPEGIVYIP